MMMSERRRLKMPTVSCSVFSSWQHILSQWWYFPILPISQRDRRSAELYFWFWLDIHIKCKAYCKQGVMSKKTLGLLLPPCQTLELQVIPVPDITKTPFQGGLVDLAQRRLLNTTCSTEIGEIISSDFHLKRWKREWKCSPTRLVCLFVGACLCFVLTWRLQLQVWVAAVGFPSPRHTTRSSELLVLACDGLFERNSNQDDGDACGLEVFPKPQKVLGFRCSSSMLKKTC